MNLNAVARLWLSIAAMVAFVGKLTTPVAAQPNVDLFEDFSTNGLPGRLFIPDQAADSARPVILFLHGAGETGNDNVSQINQNINNLIRNARDRGAFIYAPQATSFGWTSNQRTDLIMSMIDQLLDNENADPDRLYVTGLSMGGGGAWNMANRYPDRFAATVPICGVRPTNDFDPVNFLDMPTWAFHARNDLVVSKDASRGVVRQILDGVDEMSPDYPPDNDRTTTVEFVSDSLDLRYTEWPTGGHAIWPRVYSTSEMYDWMFTKSVPEPSSLGLAAFCLFVAFSFRKRMR